MFKKLSLILTLVILLLGFASCRSYPENPYIVKTSDIKNNPLNYGQHFIAVRGRVTANGTQPSLQLRWYDLADETGEIAILTTPDVPKVGEEYWVSGTVIYATKVVGARTLSIVLQEKERIKMGSNYPLILGGIIIGALVIALLYIFLLRRRKPIYETIKRAEPKGYIPEKRVEKTGETYVSESKVSKKHEETVIEEGGVEGALAILVVKSGKKGGATFPLKKKVINIGRYSSNEIVIDDSKVSRQHSKIKIEDDKFVIYDLASTNGTFVNNEKITSFELNDRDEIKIGNTILVFKIL